MTTMALAREGNVHVLTLTNGVAGNCLNDAVLSEYEAILATIEADSGDASLVITSNNAKTFSTGIDIPWLMQHPDPMIFITRLENFYIRLGLLNLPVIAAINGNAYAGGALTASCADLRLMRADRGRFCFSEVSWQSPF